MIERTLRVLEYPKIIAKVEELAGSSLGKEIIAALKPEVRLSVIQENQMITAEAVNILTQGENPPLGGLSDIRSSLKKVMLGGGLGALELLEVAATLRASRLTREFLGNNISNPSSPGAAPSILSDWGSRLGSFLSIERELERCLGPEGEVLDQASPKLGSLRSQKKVLQNRIREKLDSLIHSSENSKYLQEQLVTVRGERYVIPVKQEYRSLFPGLVHDQSASGATLFIEPLPVVEMNNQLRIVETQEEEEVARILRELSGRIKDVSPTVTISVDILARIDAAFAKARYSLAIHGSEPVFNTAGVIKLRNARHPLLTGKVVPIQLALGENYDTLVITGPNTGGKTVTLKTVGLLALMAQSGLQIPASSGSEMALFEKIFCDIGDEQSIEQSLSTFSSHLTQIVKIIAAADDPRCLVLLDELGAGTDPDEGAALAMSILTHLHGLGVRTVATTHYSELKAFAYQTAGIENAAVEFDIETLRPTYHLITGLPGSSQAFEIAAKLGLPVHLVEQARGFISAEVAKVETMLKDIEADRRKAREDRQIGENARIKGESLKDQYQTELTRLKTEKTDVLRQAKEEARQILIEARRESENLLRSLREAGLHEAGLREASHSSRNELNRVANEARRRMSENIAQLEEKPERNGNARLQAEDLSPGMRVRAVSLNQVGTVLEVGTENVHVQMGIMKINLPLQDLEVVQEEAVQIKKRNATPKGIASPNGESGLNAAQNITSEISLRGLTVDEALYELEKYLDQAILAGLHRFRVIHGKGTGALRIAVQDYLRGNPLVKSALYAEQNEGGLGATVVELRK